MLLDKPDHLRAVSSRFDPGTAIAAVASIVAFAVAAFSPALFNDGDTYWHIRAGEWMLAHHAVLRTDPFSYTYHGAPWDTQEWLAEILMALFYGWSGWSGIAVLFAAAFGATALLLASELRRWLRPLSLAVTLLLALGCVGVGMLARPHLLTFPLVVLWTRELLRAREEGRAPGWFLLPVMVLWANLHGSFVFGLALVLPFAAEAVTPAGQNRAQCASAWGKFFAAAIVAGMLTPQGVYGLIFPFRLTAMTQIAFIREWNSSSFDTLTPLEIALLTALYVFLSRGVRVGFFRLLTLLGLLHMALQHERQQTLLALCGALILAKPMGMALNPATVGPCEAHRRNGVLWPALVVLAALAGLRLALPVHRPGDEMSLKSALAQLPADYRNTPVFNDYSFGAYLIFSGIKPFIDSRADLYGDAFVLTYRKMAAGEDTLIAAAVRRYAIRWALLRPGNGANSYFSAACGWERSYADRFTILYVNRARSGECPGASKTPSF